MWWDCRAPEKKNQFLETPILIKNQTLNHAHVDDSIHHIWQDRRAAHDNIFYTVELCSVIAVFVWFFDTINNRFRLCERLQISNVYKVISSSKCWEILGTYLEEVWRLLLKSIIAWFNFRENSFVFISCIVVCMRIVKWNQIWCLKNQQMTTILHFRLDFFCNMNMNMCRCDKFKLCISHRCCNNLAQFVLQQPQALLKFVGNSSLHLGKWKNTRQIKWFWQF